MVVALNPLHKVNPIKRVTVATYQSVSGTGIAAVEELTKQSKVVLDGGNVVPHVYSHQIAFNLLPEIDVFLENGYTKEEWKMVVETKKIVGRITAVAPGKNTISIAVSGAVAAAAPAG